MASHAQVGYCVAEVVFTSVTLDVLKDMGKGVVQDMTYWHTLHPVVFSESLGSVGHGFGSPPNPSIWKKVVPFSDGGSEGS